ncbi:MAG: ABC transporter ATP-binding protein, partial [Desulfobacterales bacterium]|nr:ABC transporter ATP-binding protein [Desulfobacterales bacterium]
MTPFEPEAEKTRYQRPAVSIDPDRNKNWFWRVSPILLSHKRMFAVGLASALVALVFNVTIPRVTMQAIDLALVARQEPLMFYVWILLGLAVGRSAVVFLYRKLLFSLAYMIEYDLRTLIFEHIAWMPFSFFDRIQSGQLISRANSDIRAVQMFMVFGPFMLITIATFVLALGFMLSVHVALSIVSLLPIPLVYFTARRMRQFMFPVSWIVQSRLADVATIVEENISGVHIVKSFAAERQQIGLIAKSSEQLRWAAVRMNDVRAVFAPIMENLPRLATALVLGYGGYLVIRGQVTIGTLVAFSAYVIMLQTPFRLLGMLMTLSQRSAASAQRIFEILDTESEIVDRPGAVDLVDSKGEVAFRNVAFAYSDGPEILTDLSFRIKQGETVAVVGRTGSG